MTELLVNLTMLLAILVIIGLILLTIATMILGTVVTVSRYSSITPYTLRFKCTCGHTFLYETRHGEDEPKCDACCKGFGLTRKENVHE